MVIIFNWKRYGGYEVSSLGDKRFSALYAKLPDGRTIEQYYQCDIKGYDVGGINWKLGKGKPPINNKSKEQLWQEYLNLWRIWSKFNLPLMRELYVLASSSDYQCCLSDSYATTDINQAHALSTILNELIQNGKST